MASFTDLTPYTYHNGRFGRPTTVNIGWLGPEHPFERAVPDDHILQILWRYCCVSVAGLRGLHKCELCGGKTGYLFNRGEERLLLGAAEIRIFGQGDMMFAAPNLIYHYVADHYYRPPIPFLEAILTGASPPDPIYFDSLHRRQLPWTVTSSPLEEPVPVRFKS